MVKTALVVIDVQNMELRENTRKLPSKIATFIKNNEFDYVLFTKFINNKKSNFYKKLNYRIGFSKKETDICKELKEFTNRYNTFKKTKYSAFKSEKFANFIKNKHISRIYLCGTDTEACVLATAYDAFDLGYDVKVLKNLSGSCGGKDMEKAGNLIIGRNIQK